MSSKPFDAWIFCISGFRQNHGNLPGLQVLWRELKYQWDSYPHCNVAYHPWNTNWKDIADQVSNFRRYDRKPKVYVFAYSYGGGYGFYKLSKYLKDSGIEVEYAVLCDAVYRGLLLGKVLSYSAKWLEWPTLKRPENVKQIEWFYQRSDILCGHPVVGETGVLPGVRLPQNHYHIDESVLFREAAHLCLKTTKLEDHLKETHDEGIRNNRGIA